MGLDMKGIALVVIGFVVLAALLLSGALNPLMADLYRKLAGTSNSNSSAPDTSVPSDSTGTPQPIRNISIYYNLETVQSISSEYGPVEANSSNVFLKVTMDIENNGYGTSFSTNPALFSVTANNVEYSVDVLGTGNLGEWRTVNVANGDTYSGTLVFQVPGSASSFKLGYFQPISLNRFKIVWIAA